MSSKTICHNIEVYDRNNIYEFDTSYMLDYYSNRIIDVLGEKKMNCLELGVGQGYTTEIFSSFFERHIVLEGDRDIIQRFRKEFPNVKTNIIETFFEEWDTEERFDVIVMGFVLEHVDNPKIILNKYKRFLKPKGRIFIAVPNAEALNRRVGLYAGLLNDIEKLSENDIKAGHKRYYTLTSLKEEVEEAKLKIVREEGLFLKPITTAQMLQLNFSKEIVEGYCKVGKDYPELCLGIMLEVVKAE